MKYNQKKLIGLSLLTMGILSAPLVQGQTQVYSENFETDHTVDGTWVTNTVGGYNPVDLYFDYSSVGIPPAPNSGGTTRGLKLQANLDPAVGVFPSGSSASPTGFSITENFEMRWDWWLNFNGPLNGGGSGSTQIGGGGFGTSATTANVPTIIDAIFIGASGDGAGTSADYRVYSPSFSASYQDASGVYAAGTVGSRNNSHAYYQSTFPPVAAPSAQTNLFPQQSGETQGGSAGMAWHDVSLKKVANTLTYTIDGLLIATVDLNTAGTLGGANIVFGHFDINAGASADPNAAALAFSLVDNIRITNFSTVVSVAASTPTAKEEGLVPGVFTITRSSTGAPLTVNYTITGTATSGTDYVALPGSVTFAANDTTTNIVVTPLQDSVSEATETIILSINDSPNFQHGGSATINLIDNEPPQLAIRAISSQVYERVNDYGVFQITRLGDTNAPEFSVNVSFSGSAVFGTDFTTNGIATFLPGESALNFRVLPLPDSLVEGNETITATLVVTAPYTVGSSNSASITLVDATLPSETVLFSDNFNTDTSANWSRLFGSVPDPTEDFLALFAYDYSGDGIPPAPNSSGDSIGLRILVNKNDPTASAAALNLYPNGQSFSGNYALRFDMYLINGGGASATEYAIFGINHSGTKTNWFRNSSGGITNGSFDGFFFNVGADGSSSGDYAMYSGPASGNNPTVLAVSNAPAYAFAFKSPPWAVAGAAANVVNSTTPIWADVEVSQIAGVVTLKINNTVILRTNSTAYTSGNIMLGYDDAFDSVGPAGSTVIYDNVRVVRLTAPVAFRITSVKIVGSNVEIDFTSDLGAAGAFKLQAAPAVTGPYTDTAAVITAQGETSFRATIPTNGQMQFYRIKF